MTLTYAEIFKKYNRSALEAECVRLKNLEIDLLRTIFFLAHKIDPLRNKDELVLVFDNHAKGKHGKNGKESIEIKHPDQELFNRISDGQDIKLERYLSSIKYTGVVL